LPKAARKIVPDINLDGIEIPGGMSKELFIRHMAAASPFFWTKLNKIMLNATTPFEVDAWHLYQVDILNDTSRISCSKKGAQTGFTTNEVLKSVHGMIHGKYKYGVGYLFPTGDDAGEFTKYRFDPLIAANRCIQSHVANTDSATLKQIGRGFLHIRGARPSSNKVGDVKETSTKLKTFSADRIVFDECDEMKSNMIAMAKQRMAHSEVREEVYLSTPSIPDYGIDAMYSASDQRVWMIRCRKCNAETCMELEFPNSLRQRPDGSVYRACIKCGAEIYPFHGKWVALYPGRSKDLVGWWISQLVSKYVSPKEILETYLDPTAHNMTMQEVYNSMLGMAYIEAENRLDINTVLGCCGTEVMAMKSEDGTAIGVDVGKELHCVVGVPKTKKLLKILKVTRLSSFNDLHDLAKAYGCRCMVVDKYPETHRVRDFAKAEPYQVWLCGYQEGKKKGPTSWDEKVMEIYGNRTELLDASHTLVSDPGRLELPRIGDEIKFFASQITNVAKILEEDRASGDKVYKYKKVGNTGDHYRHALTYCMLASRKVSPLGIRQIVGRYFMRKQTEGRSWTTA